MLYYLLKKTLQLTLSLQICAILENCDLLSANFLIKNLTVFLLLTLLMHASIITSNFFLISFPTKFDTSMQLYPCF